MLALEVQPQVLVLEVRRQVLVARLAPEQLVVRVEQLPVLQERQLVQRLLPAELWGRQVAQRQPERLALQLLQELRLPPRRLQERRRPQQSRPLGP